MCVCGLSSAEYLCWRGEKLFTVVCFVHVSRAESPLNGREGGREWDIMRAITSLCQHMLPHAPNVYCPSLFYCYFPLTPQGPIKAGRGPQKSGRWGISSRLSFPFRETPYILVPPITTTPFFFALLRRCVARKRQRRPPPWLRASPSAMPPPPYPTWARRAARRWRRRGWTSRERTTRSRWRATSPRRGTGRTESSSLPRPTTTTRPSPSTPTPRLR